MVYYDTDYPADSLEFCPQPGYQDLFVCGTYKLLKDDEGDGTKTQKRIGGCLLMRYSDTSDSL